MLKVSKKWLIIFAITLFLFWGLSILTNHCQWAYAVWTIIAFPFAPLWLVFENYCLSFNNAAFPNFSHPLNDEIIEILLFLLFIIAQTSVYYWFYNKIVHFFKK